MKNGIETIGNDREALRGTLEKLERVCGKECMSITKDYGKYARFIEKILEFLKNLNTDIIITNSIINDHIYNEYVLKNWIYEVNEFNKLHIHDKNSNIDLLIKINDIIGVSNTVFEGSVACSIAFSKDGISGIILSAKC